MSAARDSFHKALVILTGHESAKARLTRAWVDGLETLKPDDLPDSIREQFHRMRERLTERRPINNEHPIVATIRKMSPVEAATFGHEIVGMYESVMVADHPVQLRIVEMTPEQPGSEPEPEAVPDFLSRH